MARTHTKSFNRKVVVRHGLIFCFIISAEFDEEITLKYKPSVF